jgi:hypothetical protein
MDGRVAQLNGAAAKLLLALLLRGGEWGTTAEMCEAAGIHRNTYSVAKAQVLASQTLVQELCMLTKRVRGDTGIGRHGTEDVQTSSRPGTLRMVKPAVIIESGGEDEGGEAVLGFYGGRQPKTAEDEAAMRRMEAIQQRIIEKKGAIRWGR